MVDLDAALGEQLFDVAVGEAKAEVPADRQHDHIRREAETGEGRPCNGIGADPASSHDASLAARVCSTADATAPSWVHGTTSPSGGCGSLPPGLSAVAHWTRNPAEAACSHSLTFVPMNAGRK